MTHYICPDCSRPTIQMDLAQEHHTPTADELTQRPDMEPIACEILKCPCGAEHTWFTVSEAVNIGPVIVKVDQDGRRKELISERESRWKN